MRPDSEEDSLNTTQSVQRVDLPITLHQVLRKDSAKKLQQESKQHLCHTIQPVPQDSSANTVKPDSKVNANTIQTVSLEDIANAIQQVDRNNVAKRIQLDSIEGSFRPVSYILMFCQYNARSSERRFIQHNATASVTSIGFNQHITTFGLVCLTLINLARE